MPPRWAVVTTGFRSAIVMPSGVVLPVLGVDDQGALRIRPICGGEALYSGPGTRIDRAHIVLDPGHGGFDPGAVQNGLREADVNLDTARRVREQLESLGLTVLLTREDDFYVPLQIRGEIALSSKAALFISIHHNSGGAGGNRAEPGTEVYYQIGKRVLEAPGRIAVGGRHTDHWCPPDLVARSGVFRCRGEAGESGCRLLRHPPAQRRSAGGAG